VVGAVVEAAARQKIEQMEKELLAGWDIPPSFALSYRCNGQAGRGGT